MNTVLLKGKAVLPNKKKLKGSLIDNYVLTYYSDFVKNNDDIRIETTYQHAITYGLVTRHNSSKMVSCFRRYIRNHPQEVFEVIANNLQPLKVKNKTNIIKCRNSVKSYIENDQLKVNHKIIKLTFRKREK